MQMKHSTSNHEESTEDAPDNKGKKTNEKTQDLAGRIQIKVLGSSGEKQSEDLVKIIAHKGIKLNDTEKLALSKSNVMDSIGKKMQSVVPNNIKML